VQGHSYFKTKILVRKIILETEQNILNKKKKIAKVILEQLGGSRFEAMTGF
jgi:hypothetical protein